MSMIREYTPAEWRAFGDQPPMAEPYLVRNACDHWPAMSQLTLHGLSALAGDVVVVAERTSKPDQKRRMRLGAFIDYCETVEERDPLYLKSWRYRETHPALHNWMEPPAAFRSWTDMISGQRPDWSWLYIAARHSGSAPHLDIWMSAAYNVVFSGCKDWRVYPAAHQVSETLQRDPSIDLADVDGGDVWTCRQMPGDLIYVPTGLAHSVVNREAGVAFTENFINGRNYASVVPLLEQQGRTDVVQTLRSLRIAAAFG